VGSSPCYKGRKETPYHVKAFSDIFCIKISSGLPTSKLIHYLHFGAFDLTPQESFRQWVTGPVDITATKGHLRAGMRQQGCMDSWRATLLGQHGLQASSISANALNCPPFYLRQL